MTTFILVTVIFHHSEWAATTAVPRREIRLPHKPCIGERLETRGVMHKVRDVIHSDRGQVILFVSDETPQGPPGA
jgi:hypothetical protein